MIRLLCFTLMIYGGLVGTGRAADVDLPATMPVRIVMMSNGLSNQAVAVAADTGIRDLSELEGTCRAPPQALICSWPLPGWRWRP